MSQQEIQQWKRGRGMVSFSGKINERGRISFDVGHLEYRTGAEWVEAVNSDAERLGQPIDRKGLAAEWKAFEKREKEEREKRVDENAVIATFVYLPVFRQRMIESAAD